MRIESIGVEFERPFSPYMPKETQAIFEWNEPVETPKGKGTIVIQMDDENWKVKLKNHTEIFHQNDIEKVTT